MTNKDIFFSLENANDIIEYFKKNETYDPFAALTGTESQKQKAFSAAVNYLYKVQEAYNNFYKEVI